MVDQIQPMIRATGPDTTPSPQSTIISVLALLFGTGSWIALTGLWMEMPLLLQRLPESWSLASYLNIMIQLANIGPLVYWALKRYRIVNDISATHLQLWIGLLSCLMLTAFWNQTFYLFGEERSVFLLIFTFGLALVDCTSSVTFLPFMARFDSRYMTPYLVGEGLSGFVPSMVVLIQGVGEQPPECEFPNDTAIVTNDQELIPINYTTAPELIEPRFSVEVFFASLTVTLLISYLAFLALQFLPLCKKERIRIKNKRLRNRIQLLPETSEPTVQPEPKSSDLSCRNQQTYYFLLGLIFWNCFTTFGFMPSLQPFSALPYSTEALHYAVILASLSYPFGCFYAMLVERRSIRLVTILSVIATILAIYILAVALMSPYPPLLATPLEGFASFFIVFCWVAFISIASYAKTIITLLICDYNNQTGMFWVGMHTQFGAATGALIIFILINYTRLFNQCP